MICNFTIYLFKNKMPAVTTFLKPQYFYFHVKILIQKLLKQNNSKFNTKKNTGKNSFKNTINFYD